MRRKFTGAKLTTEIVNASQYRSCVLPSVEPVPFADFTISAVGGARPKAGKKTISALGRVVGEHF